MGASPPLKVETPSSDGEEFAVQYREHICAQGVFVRTRELREVGEAVGFEFVLSDGSVVLGGHGTVAWVRPQANDLGPAGMGIAIAELVQGTDLIGKAAEHRWGEPSSFERGAGAPAAAAAAAAIPSGAPAAGATPAATPAAAPAAGVFGGGALAAPTTSAAPGGLPAGLAKQPSARPPAAAAPASVPAPPPAAGPSSMPPPAPAASAAPPDGPASAPPSDAPAISVPPISVPPGTPPAGPADADAARQSALVENAPDALLMAEPVPDAPSELAPDAGEAAQGRKTGFPVMAVVVVLLIAAAAAYFAVGR